MMTCSLTIPGIGRINCKDQIEFRLGKVLKWMSERNAIFYVDSCQNVFLAGNSFKSFQSITTHENAVVLQAIVLLSILALQSLGF